MIDFGIINYNSGDSLAKCVQSIQKMRGVQTRIFIYDNYSLDNSLDAIDKDKSVYIEKGKKNLGYAGACNVLLQKMNSPIQVLCNMDLEFDENWGKEILTVFENHKECSSVASLVMEKSGTVNATGIRFYPDMYAVNETEIPDQEKVFGCYGAVMTFRKEVVQKVGFLEDSYFLFFEETEWYLRHCLLDLSTIFCPKAIVWHERSKTTIRYSPLKLFYGERNRIRTAFHYLPPAYLLKLLFYSLKRYLVMQKQINHTDGPKKSKFYLIFILLKAWVYGIFGKKPKFKLSKGDKKRVLELIKKYEINTLVH